MGLDLGRVLSATTVRPWSFPAGQDVAVRWSHTMQMAGQFECKQVVKSAQLPSNLNGCPTTSPA